MAKKKDETATDESAKKSTYRTTEQKIASCTKRIKSYEEKIEALQKKIEEEKIALAKLQNKAGRKERMDFMKTITNEQLEAFKKFIEQQSKGE